MLKRLWLPLFILFFSPILFAQNQPADKSELLGGPLLTLEQAPGLYGIFTAPFGREKLSIMERMARAQESFLPNKSLAINQLVIVDSLVPRAFVLMEGQPADPTSLHTIHLTKGMVYVLLGLTAQQALHYRLTPVQWDELLPELLGILQHELGHVVDFVLKEQSIENSMGIHNQAIEHRADINGVLIAEKAGLEMDGGWRAQSRIKKLEGQRSTKTHETLTSAYSASHPATDTRLSSLATFLTGRRYQVGQATELVDLNPLKQYFQMAAEELADSTLRVRFWQKARSYRDFEEALDVLEKWIDECKNDCHKGSKRWSDRRIYEINQNFIFILKAIESSKNPAEKIIQLIQRVNKGAKMLQEFLLDPARIQQLKWRYGISADTELLSPMEYLEQSTYFNSAAHAKLIAGWLPTWDGNIHFPIFSVLPVRQLKNVFPKNYLELLPIFLGSGRQASTPEENQMWRMGVHSVYREADAIYATGDYFESLSSEGFKNLSYLQGLFPSVREFAYRRSPEIRNLEVARLRQLAGKGDKEAARTLKNYQNFLREALKHKDLLALMEYAGTCAFDWKHVAYTLNIDRDKLFKEIHQEFRSLLAQPEKFKSYSALFPIAGRRATDVRGVYAYPGKSAVDMVQENEIEKRGEMLPWLPREVSYVATFRQLFMNVDAELASGLITNNLRLDKDGYAKLYELKLRRVLDGLSPNAEIDTRAIVRAHLNAERETLGTAGRPDNRNNWNSAYAMIHLRAVMQSNLSPKQKQTWLRFMFLKDAPPGRGYVAHEAVSLKLLPKSWRDALALFPENEFAIIFKAFQQVGLASESALEFTEFWKRSNTVVSTASIAERRSKNNGYYTPLRVLAPLIEAEWETVKYLGSTEKKNWIERLIATTNPPNRDPDKTQGNSGLVRMKSLAAKLVTEHKDMGFKFQEAFDSLVETGATLKTDEFFQKFVLPNLSMEKLEDYLVRDKILRVDLRVELSRKVLGKDIQRLEEAKIVPDLEYRSFFVRLYKMNPKASAAKDEFLEELGGKFSLTGRHLHGFIEHHKSYNWLKPENMSVPQWASGAVILISHLSAQMRWDLVDYLSGRKDASVLPRLREELLKLAPEAISKAAPYLELLLPNQQPEMLKQFAVEFLINEIETFHLQAGEMERVPVLEAIISAGQNSLRRAPTFLDLVLQDRLKMVSGSKKDKLMRVLLKILPPHEYTVTLAYLLASSKSGSMNAAELFKIGSTVGIKFGQASGIWNLFDDEISAQSKKLKDNAGGMSRAQVEAVLENEKLKNPIFRQIKSIDRVLGAASIKTVVLVTLHNGDLAVLAVRNPAIKGQVRSNIAMSKKLIAALREEGVFEGTEFFNLLVSALEEQIFREIEFDHEAKMLVKLRKAILELNQELRRDLGDWNLDVVQTFTEDSYTEEAMLMKLAKGVTYDKLEGEMKVQAGRVIVKSVLALFFRKGLFEPDRHKGNFFIDTSGDKPRLMLIDAGQLEEFVTKGPLTWDDRLTVADMLEAVQYRDAQKLIAAAKKMAKSSGKTVDMTKLEREIKENFAKYSKDYAKLAQEMVKTLTENGIHFRTEFSFGLIKGLMILAGEQYVGFNEFITILRAEVAGLYLRKPLHLAPKLPGLVREKARSLFKNCTETMSLQGAK